MAGKKGMKSKLDKSNSKRYVEYYEKNYPELSKEECEAKAKWFRRSCNYNSIEYYERNYPDLSHEEHLKLKFEANVNRKANNKLNIAYYNKNYPELSQKERDKLCHEYNKTQNYQCIEYYQTRHPELSKEECENLRLEAIKSYTSKRDQTGERNGMHHSKTSEHKRRSVSPHCIEFYETRFPEASHEEHKQMLANHFEYNKECVKNAVKDTNIEYYLNQGMSIKEATEALKERQTTFSLEKCIAKYGEIEGKKRFKERQEKWKKSLRENFEEYGDGRSMQSQAAHHIIKVLCERLNINYPEKEMILFKKDGKAYAYDFTYKNKIIEYNGDYWHCNPRKYDANYYHQVGECTAKDIWDRDADKIALAKSKGYDVLSVWEMDYKENPTSIIEQCYNFVIS